MESMENEKKASEKSLEYRSIMAASRYLENKGFEIKATGYTCAAGECDIVAYDPEGCKLAFVDVIHGKGSIPAEGASEDERARREGVAVAYMADNRSLLDDEFTVRFDNIAIAIMSDDRALLRYHINVLGAPQDGDTAGCDRRVEAQRWADAICSPDSRGTSLARMLEDEISRRAEVEGWHSEWEQCLDAAQARKAS